MFSKIKKFVEESYQELKKVSWPKKEEIVGSTGVVIGAVIVISLLLGAFDVSWRWLVMLLLG